MNPKKTSVHIYSGHVEIVEGGDVKYLVDLIQNVDRDQFTVSLSTDINKAFERNVAPNLKKHASLVYLATRPKLFKKLLPDQFYEALEQHRSHSVLHRLLYRILTLSWRGKSLFELFRFVYRGITLERLRNFFWNFWVFYTLFKSQAKEIDVFHFNNGGYPAKEAGLTALLLARWFGIRRRILTFHNIPSAKFWYRPIDHFFDYLISQSCTHIIAASEILKKNLISQRGFPQEKINILYCGLEDKDPLNPEERKTCRDTLNIKSDSLVILICGSLDQERKGHAPLFKALSRLKSEFPTFLLLVVGQGNQQRMKYFSEMIQILKIEENVKFLGYRTDIHELNSIADIVVVPSTSLEATPYTIKEAARAEKPVVTTYAGGCAEAVVQDVTGLIVEPNNEAALSEALSTLLKDEKLRLKMGKAARQLFLEKFLLSEKVKQHERIYAHG